MNIYEINNSISSLIDQYNTVEDDDVREAIAKELDILEISRDEKLSSLCAVVKNLESDEEAYANEIKRLKKEKDYVESKIERIRVCISNCLGVGNKWQSGVHKLSWRESKALIVDETKGVFPEFQKVVYEVDKASVKEHLDGGGSPLPFAWYEQRKNLQIK